MDINEICIKNEILILVVIGKSMENNPLESNHNHLLIHRSQVEVESQLKAYVNKPTYPYLGEQTGPTPSQFSFTDYNMIVCFTYIRITQQYIYVVKRYRTIEFCFILLTPMLRRLWRHYTFLRYIIHVHYIKLHYTLVCSLRQHFLVEKYYKEKEHLCMSSKFISIKCDRLVSFCENVTTHMPYSHTLAIKHVTNDST